MALISTLPPGNRANPDKVKQVLLLLIHHAVVIFQPLWPPDHPRPPHVNDMLKARTTARARAPARSQR